MGVRWTALAADGDTLVALVELDGVEHNLLGEGPRLDPADAAQDGIDAPLHFAQAKGLGHIIVGTQVKPFDDIVRLVERGQHDQGDIGDFADFAANIKAAHVREHNVQQAPFQSVPSRSIGERAASFTDDSDGVADPFQRKLEHFLNGNFILDDEDVNVRAVDYWVLREPICCPS